MDAQTKQGNFAKRLSKAAADPPPFTEPFTIDDLKVLLESHRVIRSGRLPNADGLQRLARQLDKYCKWARRKTEPLRVHDARTERIANAVRTLIKEIPAQCEHIRELLGVMRDAKDPDEAYLGGVMWWKLLHYEHKALSIILAAVQDAQRYPGCAFIPVSQFIKAAERWHHFAPALANAFTAAMQTTNPGWKFGISAKSPGPRFIVAVMPRITGETPSEDTIAQFFKRRRKRGTQEKPAVPGTANPWTVPQL
jgi:hypothetical protein